LTSTSARDSSSSTPSAPMGSATRILGMEIFLFLSGN